MHLFLNVQDCEIQECSSTKLPVVSCLYLEVIQLEFVLSLVLYHNTNLNRVSIRLKII